MAEECPACKKKELTVRDHFAMAVLKGFIIQRTAKIDDTEISALIDTSYRFADAALIRRVR